MSIDKSSDSRRLFFGLWPGKVLQERLLDVQRITATVGRPVPKERFHLTLAFLGETSSRREDQLIQQASEVSQRAFSFSVSRLGYFRRPRILWAGPSEVPLGLDSLHKKLAAVIYQSEPDKLSGQFCPHVTLARDAEVSKVTDLPSPIPWQVSHFHLVHSRLSAAGPEYHTIATFRLEVDR